MANIYLAPKGYHKDDPNPFTPDGTYGHMWTILVIDEKTKYELFQGKTKYGCYAVIMSPHHEHFHHLFADFIQYETAHGRNILLSSEKEQSLDFTSHYQEAIVRPSDAPLLVHSTMLTTYAKITNDGCLKSVTRLRKEGFPIHPIGLAPLAEPQDYLDYVMFAAKGLAPEFVISVRLTGKITCDPDELYTPQARMYFDGHKLVKDGLVTRNLGIKVYDHVPLDKYLLCVVTANDLTLPEGQAGWTPSLFSKMADEWVKERLF